MKNKYSENFKGLVKIGNVLYRKRMCLGTGLLTFCQRSLGTDLTYPIDTYR